MAHESLRDLTILVTGTTDGIGIHTAELLARAGAVVVVHGRDPNKVARTVDALRDRGARADGIVADLASLGETARLARDVAARFPTLDVLVNNAGVGFGADPKLRETSRDGYELRFAVNYLAPFLLTEELLARGLPRRALVNVASIGQEALDFNDLMTKHDYDGVRAYCKSKLALIMLTFDVADAFPGIAANALHPGSLLDTNMVRDAGIAPRGPASRGGEATVAVIEASLAGATGTYFDQERPDKALPPAYDRPTRERLRAKAQALVGAFRSRK